MKQKYSQQEGCRMSQLIFESCCSYFKNVNCEMLNEWMRNKLGLVRLTCGTDVVE